MHSTGAVFIAACLLAAFVAVGVQVGVPVQHRLPSSEIRAEQGHAYTAVVYLPWPLVVAADDLGSAQSSKTRLLEDGEPLGPGHAVHDGIRSAGGGRYSHWQKSLYFSTSDNSDPRTNGRRYTAILRVRLAPQLLSATLLLVGLVAAYAGWRALGVLAVGIRSRRIGALDLVGPGLLLAGSAAVAASASRVAGALLWLLLGLLAVLTIWTAAAARRGYRKAADRPRNGFGGAQKATLVAVSLCLALMAAEVFLGIRERRVAADATADAATEAVTKSVAEATRKESVAEAEPLPARVQPVESRSPSGPPAAASDGIATKAAAESPIEKALDSFGVNLPRQVVRQAAARAALATQPPEFDRVLAHVEGAVRAEKWHGVVHVYDDNRMRRVGPFPQKRDEVFRVVVVGDSLTYGDGIAEEWTYSRQLESLLSRDYRVEVLNLGVDGYQSEDVVDVVERFLPLLEPDLVVYGVCLNDFLPSGIGQYTDHFAYALPLPAKLKQFFMDSSRVVRLSEYGYNQLLLRLRLRVDFLDDILKDFGDYQKRFGRDAEKLNRIVTARGLPSVVALTLDQYPSLESRGHRISRAAERRLRSAGMDVVEMDSYYRQFDGMSFGVSRWEGHPNEVANSIWAVMLERHLRGLQQLSEFRK